MTSRLLAAGAGLLLLAGAAHSAEIKVLSTQATEDAYKELVPQFDQATGHKVTTVFTGTLGADKRLADGESYDMLDHVERLIDEYLKSGKLAAGSGSTSPSQASASGSRLARASPTSPRSRR